MSEFFFLWGGGGGGGKTTNTTVYEKMVRCPLIFTEAFFLSGGGGGYVRACVGDIQSRAVSRSDINNKRGHGQFSL